MSHGKEGEGWRGGLDRVMGGVTAVAYRFLGCLRGSGGGMIHHIGIGFLERGSSICYSFLWFRLPEIAAVAPVSGRGWGNTMTIDSTDTDGGKEERDASCAYES